MAHDFHRVICRDNTLSVKHDREYLKSQFNVTGDDTVSMWIADMDFMCPPCVTEAVTKLATHGIYGYSEPLTDFYEKVVAWQKERHDWHIEKDWIVPFTGLVPALAYMVNCFTQPGDKVIVQPPVYHPFRRVINANGRETLDNPLILKDGRYYIDFEDLEEKAKQAKMIVLCSPHNPVGQVWAKEDLMRLGDICNRHGVLVVADEIHNDLVFPNAGVSHTTYATLGEAYAQNAVILTAASKTFNVAGLCLGYAILPNDALRKRVREETIKIQVSLNAFGIAATTAAYSPEGIAWLEELLAYLEGNINFMDEYFKTHLPKLGFSKPEATYLAWLDCRAYEPNGEKLEAAMLEQNLLLNGGRMFGLGGEGYLRVNFACPRETLAKGLDKLRLALQK